MSLARSNKHQYKFNWIVLACIYFRQHRCVGKSMILAQAHNKSSRRN